MVSDYIPKYYIETEEFKALANAYDTVIQPLIDALEVTFSNCKAPIYMSEHELLPLLIAAGYDEARKMSLDEMRDLFIDILKNRRLMTDDGFVKQLRRAFETESGEEDPWELRIRRYKNVLVTVDTDIEDLDSKSVTYGESPAFVYDILAKNIMLSFPAGVRLRLNANMKSNHTMYIGAYGTVTTQLFGDINAWDDSRYLYDAAHVRKSYEYNPANSTYNVDGTWKTIDELSEMGLKANAYYDADYIGRDASSANYWNFPEAGDYIWLKSEDEDKEIDAPYTMDIAMIKVGDRILKKSAWSDADYTVFPGVGIPNTGDTHLVRITAENNVLHDIQNIGGLRVSFSAYIPIENVINISVRRTSDSQSFPAYGLVSGEHKYYFVFDDIQTRWVTNLQSIGYVYNALTLTTYNTNTQEDDGTVYYDQMSDEYSSDAITWTDAETYYATGYESGFGMAVGIRDRLQNPQIMIYKKSQDYTKQGDVYSVIIPTFYLENRASTIKRIMVEYGEDPDTVDEMIEYALEHEGMFIEERTYAFCNTIAALFEGSLVNAYVIESYYYPGTSFLNYAFAYEDDRFVYDGETQSAYGIDGEPWRNAVDLHNEKGWTLEPSTSVRVWEEGSGEEIEGAFICSSREPEEAGWYYVPNYGMFETEEDLNDAGLSLTQVVVSYLYNADGDTLTPCIYDDESETVEIADPPVAYYYFSSQGSSGTTDSMVGGNSRYALFNADGSYAVFDSSKTYTIVNIYTYDGVEITPRDDDYISSSAIDPTELVWFSSGALYSAYRIGISVE